MHKYKYANSGRNVILTFVVVTCALLLAGCGESSTAKLVDQEEAQNPQLVGQTCVEIQNAKATGALFSYYRSFRLSYEKALAGGKGAPSARSVFAEIERRCKNPAR